MEQLKHTNKKYNIKLYGVSLWDNFQINHTIEGRQVEASFYLCSETHSWCAISKGENRRGST